MWGPLIRGSDNRGDSITNARLRHESFVRDGLRKRRGSNNLTSFRRTDAHARKALVGGCPDCLKGAPLLLRRIPRTRKSVGVHTWNDVAREYLSSVNRAALLARNLHCLSKTNSMRENTLTSLHMHQSALDGSQCVAGDAAVRRGVDVLPVLSRQERGEHQGAVRTHVSKSNNR